MTEEMHTRQDRCASTLYGSQCQQQRRHNGAHFAESVLTLSGEMVWTDDPFDDGGVPLDRQTRDGSDPAGPRCSDWYEDQPCRRRRGHDGLHNSGALAWEPAP